MKRLMTVILLVLVSFSIISCKKNNGESTNKSSSSQNVSSSKSTDKTSSKSQSSEDHLSDSTSEINPSEAIIENKTIEAINYPVISVIDNAPTINGTISQFVQEMSATYENNLIADYQITFQDREILSIYFTGNIENAAYPRQFKSGLTIDLKSGAAIPLTTILAKKNISQQTIEAELSTILEEKGTNLSTVFPDGLDSLLANSDTTSVISEVNYYLTENSVTCIFAVPHAVGDFVEVTIPYN